MRRIEVQRLLVLQLRHLDVHAGVDVAVKVCREHGAVGRELDAADGLVAVELAAHALRADGAGEKTDLHPVPGIRVAGDVRTVGMRPEVDTEHAHRRVRVMELVAAGRCVANTADEIQSAAHDVGDALVVVSVYVVHRPVRASDDRLEPHLERTRALAVRRHLEEVAAAVGRDAHPLLRLRYPEVLLAQFVVHVYVVDVAGAVRLLQLPEKLRLPLADGEVDVARSDRNHLHHAFGTLSKRRVQEERVDLTVVQRLHRADARRNLHVRRREPRMLEVLRAVVVRYLPLRHGRVANPHARPFGDLRGHELHRARGGRVEREVHAPERLLREVEVLEQLLRAERRAYHVGLRDVQEVVFAELHARRLYAGGLEHVVHYRDAELVVRGRPEVELRVALAVRDPHCLGIRRKRV